MPNNKPMARLAAMLLLTATVPAQAGLIIQSGAGFDIPDGEPAGVFSDISITDAFSITNVRVTLNDLNHPWVGDLIASITHLETGTSVDLFNRIGRVSGGFGDSSDFSGDYAFDDAFTGDLWAVAAALDGNQVIPSGEYFATTAGSSAQTFLSVFNGQSTAGTWRLSMSDNAGADVGYLGSWTLTLTHADAPEPSTLLLGMLGGLLGLGIARRRRAAPVTSPQA